MGPPMPRSLLQAETPLLTPNILVCSVGTEILVDGAWAPPPKKALDRKWSGPGLQLLLHDSCQLTEHTTCALPYPLRLPALPAGKMDVEWEHHLDEQWNRDAVSSICARFPELVLQVSCSLVARKSPKYYS
jgi:hypothetical protein